MRLQSVLKPLSAARRFLSKSYRSLFLVRRYEGYLSTGYECPFDQGISTEQQKARWHAGVDHADMFYDCPVCFFVCVGLLSICLVMTGIELIGAL
jgi:hypothetical protein